MRNETIEWQAAEYRHQEKSREWYIGLSIIAAALIVVAVLLDNYLFAIVIVIASVTLTLLARKNPDLIHASVTRHGITVNKNFYPYGYLDSFWIESSEPDNIKLLIASKKLLMPLIIIPVNPEDENDLRNFLINYLREKHHQEPLSHKLMEHLGI